MGLSEILVIIFGGGLSGLLTAFATLWAERRRINLETDDQQHSQFSTDFQTAVEVYRQIVVETQARLQELLEEVAHLREQVRRAEVRRYRWIALFRELVNPVQEHEPELIEHLKKKYNDLDL